ncbi:unnamed protein product [Ectocarpus sp. 12 AP-2014]
MEASSSPDAKRARVSISGDTQREETSSGETGGAAAPASRSMTARCIGSAPEGEYDPLLDDPVVGEELEGLMGDPPSASQEPEVLKLLDAAMKDPESIRAYIATRAKELAMGKGCKHTAPLVTWREDSDAARTCGQHQASLLANLDMQTILDRQIELDGDPGYCLAKRVRNQIYYESSTDLGAVGVGNQCKAGKCMLAAVEMFAGKKMVGSPKR